MIEREPKEPTLHFKLGEEIVDSTPHNTILFIHNNETEEKFDHVFIFNPDEEDSKEGYFVFRQGVDDFDSLAEHMQETGFTIIQYDESHLNDRLAYYRVYPPEDNPKDLTPRQEKRVEYLGYLLASDLLTPEMFETPGELFL
jgi:hypothetical protein